MTDFTQRSELEAKTYELFGNFRAQTGWDPSIIMVANVFQALWSSALTVERIKAVGEALSATHHWNPQPALTRLVKAKVLRSYVKQGRRLYEVNY
jgi:hypothetical protein